MAKISFFLTKILGFLQNFDFSPKLQFLPKKTLVFYPKFGFQPKFPFRLILNHWIRYFTPQDIGWTNFHHFCYWDLFWSYGIIGRFKEAAHFANKLYLESIWSPAIYSWLQATVLVIFFLENLLEIFVKFSKNMILILWKKLFFSSKF